MELPRARGSQGKRQLKKDCINYPICKRNKAVASCNYCDNYAVNYDLFSYISTKGNKFNLG
jgi:hypothetical protein